MTPTPLRLAWHDDRLCVVKEVGPDHAADRLAHEARALAAAAGPGVVTLVPAPPGADVRDGGALLCLRYAGRSLGGPVADPAFARRLLTLVADLHDRGLVHGRLDADHVLVAPDGGPVLCGFGGAAVGDEGPPGGPAPRPADDLDALRRLVGPLLPPVGESEAVPIPPPEDPAASAQALRRLAAAITTAPPTGEPAGAAPRRRRSSGSGARRGAVAAGLALTFAGGALLAAGPAAPDAGPHATSTADAAGTLEADDSPSRAPAGTDVPTAPPPDLPCPAPEACSRVGGGGVVTFGDRQYRAGNGDDQVAIADWHCSGREQLALLRPDGTLFTFDTWAEPDRPVTGIERARFPPGAQLLPTALDGRRCAPLAVRRPDGSVTVVDDGGHR